MRERKKIRGSAIFFGATGWLFADLLLALAMVFLVASPSGENFNPIATPPPPCTPTPAPKPALNTRSMEITVTYDPAAIPSAQSQVRSAITKQFKTKYPGQQLEQSHAGLVILFGGAPLIADSNASVSNDKAFFSRVLLAMGKGSAPFVFTGNVAQSDLSDFNQPFSHMRLVIFFFTVPEAAKFSGTCALPTAQPTAAAQAADSNRYG